MKVADASSAAASRMRSTRSAGTVASMTMQVMNSRKGPGREWLVMVDAAIRLFGTTTMLPKSSFSRVLRQLIS